MELKELIEKEVDKQLTEKFNDILGNTILVKCDEVLSRLSETLMLSLIGHMNEEKRKWEEKWGTGRIQEAYGIDGGITIKKCPPEETFLRDPDLIYGDEKDEEVCYSGAGEPGELTDKEIYEIHKAIREANDREQ